MKKIIVYSIILCIVFSMFSCEYELKKVYPIVSLETRKSDSGGSFILGTGSIEGIVHYFSYRKLDENKYILTKHRALRTIIIESDESPKYEIWSDKWHSNTYYLYIPYGTIIKEFSTKIK